jgi:tRNA dimethylallyltransferase
MEQKRMRRENNIIIITGPTASGKSHLALETAATFNGEIITADSMQVYKGMDIGTAKPSPEEQKAVPHHLVDIMDISEPLDVYKYVDLARRKIKEISAKGKLPVIAGGTGFYIKSLIYGLDPLPGDRKLREKLNGEFDNDKGYPELLKIMKEKDPPDFEKWRKNRRKLIRALEVFTITGKSITELQATNIPEPAFPFVSFTLAWEREELKRRIADRTEVMLEKGWIEEARRVIRQGLLESPTAHQALGYKVIAAYLNGIVDYDEMKSKIITATWQFARRQISWFRNKSPESITVKMPEHASDINRFRRLLQKAEF